MDEYFKTLIRTPSISGEESLLQKTVIRELEPYGKEMFGDLINNCSVRVGAGPENVLITAHEDEIGFIITYINPQGFLYFQPIGGVDPDITVGQVVNVLTTRGPVAGIVGKEEEWETVSSEKSDTIKPYRELWIDIGSKKVATEVVKVGDLVVFDTTYKELPDNYVMARGADNKVGVYIVSEVVKRFSKDPNPLVSLYGVATAQEEIGSRGVGPVVNRIRPRYSVIVDTAIATDVPIADIEEQGDLQLGKGPAISRGSSVDPDLFFILKETAKRTKIPYQVISGANFKATDADPIQISGLGSSTILVCIPMRYHHFPAEIFCWDDVENCITLIILFLKSLREDTKVSG